MILHHQSRVYIFFHMRKFFLHQFLIPTVSHDRQVESAMSANIKCIYHMHTQCSKYTLNATTKFVSLDYCQLWWCEVFFLQKTFASALQQTTFLHMSRRQLIFLKRPDTRFIHVQQFTSRLHVTCSIIGEENGDQKVKMHISNLKTSYFIKKVDIKKNNYRVCVTASASDHNHLIPDEKRHFM